MNSLEHKLPRWPFVILALLFVLATSSAFVRRPIHNDEAWIGQQVWSLQKQGYVTSDLFQDCPPLDQEIVVYHKQLVWVGEAVSALFGWGLYQLRAVSLVAGILTLLFLSLAKHEKASSPVRVLTVALLMLTPVFWLQMLEFRPEALLLLSGTASFIALRQGVAGSRPIWIVLSALLAGMAGLCHAFGFAYVIAGTVALAFDRRWRSAVWFALLGIIAFAPYLSGYFTDRELFIAQTLHNPLMTTSFDYHWWSPLLNLVSEHKRLLRKPEVIGVTVLFLLALFSVNREFLRRHRFTLIYLATLFVVIGASPLPKFTRYMVPLVPLMALVVSAILVRRTPPDGARQRVVTFALRAWLVIFVGYGLYALGAEALQPENRQVATNQKLAEAMQPGSRVIAPFDFVFMQQGRFTILNWWGAARVAAGNKPAGFLERYAAAHHVRYLILDPVALAEWNIAADSLGSTFDNFRLRQSLPEDHRYLFKITP